MTTRIRHPQNAPGPFYVEDGCCTLCGVPETLAPEMFGSDTSHCFVKRQPESTGDIDRAIEVMWSSEVRCVRYSGTDLDILRRLAQLGEADLTDAPQPVGVVWQQRNHAAVSTTDDTLRTLTAEQVAMLLTAHLQGRALGEYSIVRGPCSAQVCEISINWFEFRFHRVVISVVERADVRWLINHHGPQGLSVTIHDWLHSESRCSVRWLTADEWARNQPGQSLPW
jgi:hypothetical protein